MNRTSVEDLNYLYLRALPQKRKIEEFKCDKCCHEFSAEESFYCEKCEYGLPDNGCLCEKCYTAAECDFCGDVCCVYCVEESKKTFPCCGRITCGTGTYRDWEGSCYIHHNILEYECGHESCTIDYEVGEEEGNCPACKDDLSSSDEESSFNSSDDDDEDSEAEEEAEAEAMAEEKARNEDVKLIKSMMVRINDSKVKTMLQDIVDDPEGKKRYPQNTCGVCRCDRVS